MRRTPVLCLLVSVAVLAASGCGGRHAAASDQAIPPVAQQVRTALTDALRAPAFPDPLHPAQPLPFVAVDRCVGPARGQAGVYRCAVTPRGARGVRSIVVDVRPDGSWSTRPLSVTAAIRGHSRAAAAGVFGVGLRLAR